MALPTKNDVQQVDEVLTNMLVGYKQSDDRFVAERAFPVVPVNADSGTYYIYTKKYWFLDWFQERAPGGAFTQVDAGVSSTTYKTVQWAGETSVPDEVKANSLVPMDQIQAKVQQLGQASLIKKEVKFAADFMAAVWGTDGSVTAKFDSHGSSDPWKDIADTAMRIVSNNIGVTPNVAVMGYIVHSRLMNHPDLIDRIKYTNAVTSGKMNSVLAELFGLDEWLVSKASYSNTNEGATFSASACIDDDILLMYRQPTPSIFSPSAGYTFSWAGCGGMGSIYYVRDPRHHVDLVQSKEAWDQKVVSSDAGYIFRDCTD